MDETRLEVDRIRCDGHGLCAELLPELIRLDEWGYPIVRPGPVPGHLAGHARRAAAACPLLALRLRSSPRPDPDPGGHGRGGAGGLPSRPRG
jgi:ferredoxin